MNTPNDTPGQDERLSLRSDWLRAAGKWLRTIYDFHIIIYREFVADNLMLRAMSLTQGTVLSLVPLLVILIALFKLLGGGEWFDEVVRPGLIDLLAPGVEPVVSERVTHMISGYAAKTLGIVGGALLILGVHGIFLAVEMTFNRIWGGSPRGRLLVRAPVYWGLLFLTPFLVAGSIGITTYLTALTVPSEISFFEVIARHLAPGAMVTISMLLIFRFLPTAPVKWSSALVGALYAGFTYETVKSLFIFYARELVRYDALYGSLAILPMMLIWINLAWIVTLFGVEICYVYQHFEHLRKETKHVPLSRLQQDTLGWCVVRTALSHADQNDKWVDADKLSDQWGVPPGVMNEIVKRLVTAKIFLRKDRSMNIIRLGKSASEIHIGDIDHALRTQSTEIWIWPEEPLWVETRLWLQLRERRGVVKTETLEKMDARLTTHEWTPRAPK